MIQIDMPIPERCGVCFAMHTDDIGLESWCGIDETARDIYTEEINTKRPDWCPLKEQDAVEPQTDEYGNKHCGACGQKLQSLFDPDLYCRKCGRKVKWE